MIIACNWSYFRECIYVYECYQNYNGGIWEEEQAKAVSGNGGATQGYVIDY